jgi:hypothetical protein
MYTNLRRFLSQLTHVRVRAVHKELIMHISVPI